MVKRDLWRSAGRAVWIVPDSKSVRVGPAGSLSGLAVGEFADDVEVTDVAGVLL